MEKRFEISEGLLIISQNSFSGNFTVTFNGVKMNAITKNKFKYGDHEVTIFGSTFAGYSFLFDGKEKGVITEKLPWYIFVLALAPFVWSIILGNLSFLVDYGFYYVGGAIGGAISGGLSFLALFLCANAQKTWVRLLICFASWLIIFGLCFGIGNLIVLIFKK